MSGQTILFLACMGACTLAAGTCESLATLVLPNTTMTSATVAAAENLPAYCRVDGTIKPTADSAILFEVWMPSAGWNGKFKENGNGGYAGAMNYQSMKAALSDGYATASTDTGHQAGGTDARWALDHPEKVIDFGYRAIHETTEKAKAIIRAFYGEGPRRSYFSSCSNGGRQALMEAQRYPADYDGIIAGAPANYWTRLLAAAAYDVQATLADPASYIPAAKLPAIEAAALDACDAKDGVKDGVIEDPEHCTFDASKLLCKASESDACLTAPQVAALRKIYGGLRNSKGNRLFPGYSPGGEAEPGGWGLWITGTAPQQSLMYAFGTQFYKNILYGDPAWDFKTFDADRDTKAADDKMAQILNATNPDLTPFKARGGKLVLYHGWSDAAIPATNAIDYYKSVIAKMGASSAGSFVRLYMAPGVEHCGGGAGPDSFAGEIDKAVEAWVESGVAPNRVVASKMSKGQVVRTRPLCPYPQVAHWSGNGSTDDAANFACAKP